MDDELRTDTASDLSIKHLSVAAEGEDAESEMAILSNLLSSIQAQGDVSSGPTATILHGIGVPPPRPNRGGD